MARCGFVGKPGASDPSDYASPADGLAPGAKAGVLEMPTPHRMLTLADATAASDQTLVGRNLALAGKSCGSTRARAGGSSRWRGRGIP